eukprot:2133096-Alexandrium_andersonii.AAC.1
MKRTGGRANGVPCSPHWDVVNSTGPAGTAGERGPAAPQPVSSGCDSQGVGPARTPPSLGAAGPRGDGGT